MHTAKNIVICSDGTGNSGGKAGSESNIDAPPSALDDEVDDRYQNVTIRFIGVFDTVDAIGGIGLLGQISW